MTPSVGLIIRTVAEFHGVAGEDILAHPVADTNAHAREHAIWLARQMTSRSLARLGEDFGVDGSHIMSVVRRVDQDRDDERRGDKAALNALMKGIQEIAACSSTPLHLLPTEMDVDAIAHDVLRSPRGASMASVQDIRALAQGYLALQSIPNELADFCGAIAAVIQAHDQNEAARTPAQVTVAHGKLKRALDALKAAFASDDDPAHQTSQHHEEATHG